MLSLMFALGFVGAHCPGMGSPIDTAYDYVEPVEIPAVWAQPWQPIGFRPYYRAITDRQLVTMVWCA